MMPKQQTDASQINSFQKDTQRKVATILAERGQSGPFEIVELPPEPWGGSKTNELAVKSTVSNYELWIYTDGANVLGYKVDKRFEISDYTSLGDLQSAFLDFLRKMPQQQIDASELFAVLGRIETGGDLSVEEVKTLKWDVGKDFGPLIQHIYRELIMFADDQDLRARDRDYDQSRRSLLSSLYDELKRALGPR